MKIEYKNQKKKQLTFKDLKGGDCFMLNNYSGHFVKWLYAYTTKDNTILNSFCFEENCAKNVIETQNVILVDAKVVIS